MTSRIVLRIRGEQVYEVRRAAHARGSGAGERWSARRRSPAVRLFVDRAQAVKPEFTLTAENAAAVADICRRSRACRWRSSSPRRRCACSPRRASPQRLEHSLPLLTASVRDLPDRHRTMRATIDWSVSLLPAEQRDLLEDLGVFATRFTLDAVEAVGAGGSWDGQRLGRARRSSSTRRWCKQVEIGGRSAFSLLAIMREYALGRLKERGEADIMRAAHADYYAGLVRAGRPNCAARVRPTPCGGSAWSCRTCALPHDTSSTRTGSTMPVTSRGACWSTGGSRASSPRCGCG